MTVGKGFSINPDDLSSALRVSMVGEENCFMVIHTFSQTHTYSTPMNTYTHCKYKNIYVLILIFIGNLEGSPAF